MESSISSYERQIKKGPMASMEQRYGSGKQSISLSGDFFLSFENIHPQIRVSLHVLGKLFQLIEINIRLRHFHQIIQDRVHSALVMGLPRSMKNPLQLLFRQYPPAHDAVDHLGQFFDGYSLICQDAPSFMDSPSQYMVKRAFGDRENKPILQKTDEVLAAETIGPDFGRLTNFADTGIRLYHSLDQGIV
jgi:hypothetical protein